MRVRINVPSHLGVYKLNKKERMSSARRLIDRYSKLFEKMRQEITGFVLVVDNKEYFIEPRK